MIITRLIGGLGNQLFQYAVARNLAIRHSTDVYLDLSPFREYTLHKYCLHHFNIQAYLANESEIDAFRAVRNESLRSRANAAVSRCLRGLRRLPTPSAGKMDRDGHLKRRYVTEGRLFFQPYILELPDNTYLDGYWQDERYFQRIEPTLRLEYTVSTAPTIANARLAQMIAGLNSVSVHVRRADYVTNPETLAFHGVCGPSYYTRCAARMRQQVPDAHFFVFSDDPGWAAANLTLGGPTIFVNGNSADYNYEDMRLMSLCRHHITANSSFSWWGAWLNPQPDKIVLCPEYWLADRRSGLQEIAPPGWERVANTVPGSPTS